MAEQEETKEVACEEKQECCSKHKCSCMHKIFGLKGLSTIYKVLSVLVVLYLIYYVAMIWYFFFTQGVPAMDAVMATVQGIVTFGFSALVLLTVSRVLKVLKKIKHAVEHK